MIRLFICVLVGVEELDLSAPSFADFCNLLMRPRGPRHIEVLRDGEPVAITLENGSPPR